MLSTKFSNELCTMWMVIREKGACFSGKFAHHTQASLLACFMVCLLANLSIATLFAKDGRLASQSLQSHSRHTDGLPSVAPPLPTTNEIFIPRQTNLHLRNDLPLPSIYMDGTIDGFNSYTRTATSDNATGQFKSFIQAFQPMKTVALTNIGSEPILSPIVRVNGNGMWRSIEQLSSKITEGAATDEAKIKLLWNFLRNYRSAGYPLQGYVAAKPLQMINASGVGYCSTWALTLENLIDALGIPGRYVQLNGHSATEAFYNGGYHLFDPHYEFFFLNWANNDVASAYQVLTDRSLLERTIGTPSRTGEYPASTIQEYNLNYSDQMFGDNSYSPSAPLSFTLWPSESLTYYWDLIHERRSQANSGDEYYADTALVAALKRPFSTPGIFEMSAPCFFVGAEIELNVFFDAARIQVSLDGFTWNDVGVFSTGSHRISLDRWIDKEANPEIYQFYIKVDGAIKASMLTGYFQVARQVLPSLALGTNTIEIDAQSRYDVELHLEWNESSYTSEPSAISSPLYPEHQSALSGPPDSISWPVPQDPDGDRIVDYEFILSDDPLCRWPLSPNFDRLLSKTSDAGRNSFKIHPMDASFFNPHQIYYWKVRAQDENGVWGAWSPVFEFSIEDPEPPELSSPTDRSVLPGTQVTLEWSAVPGASGYWVTYRSDWGEWISQYSTETSATLTELTPGLRYYWRVKSENSLGVQSDDSYLWSFIISAVPPDSPTLVSPSPGEEIIGTTAVTLAWSPVPEANGYLILYTEYGGNWIYRYSDDTSLTVSDLTPGLYFWTVRSVNDLGLASEYPPPSNFTFGKRSAGPCTGFIRRQPEGQWRTAPSLQAKKDCKAE